jgi:hypothetical protein
MAGLVPAIHGAKNVDARDKPGHDEADTPRSYAACRSGVQANSG